MIEQIDYFTSVHKSGLGQYKFTFLNKDPVYVVFGQSNDPKTYLQAQGISYVSIFHLDGTMSTVDVSKLISTTNVRFFIEL